MRGNGAKYSYHRPHAAKFLALERYAIGDALQERAIHELFIDWLFRQTESCSLTAAFYLYKFDLRKNLPDSIEKKQKM